ncbi:MULTISPECIES: DUF397 domain-containing protein [Streptomyces]
MPSRTPEKASALPEKLVTTKTLTATDLPGAAWRKSSHSGGEQGPCVEVADVFAAHQGIAVRDSKAPNGPVPLITPASYSRFISDMQAGRLHA